jgi:hypothetical protein
VMTPAFDSVWDALRWLEKNILSDDFGRAEPRGVSQWM